jgi:hypothetical protein
LKPWSHQHNLPVSVSSLSFVTARQSFLRWWDTKETTPAPMSNWPAAAAQPMSGGMAPTTAPTHVFATLTTFSGVYTAAYSPMFAAPSAAVVPFACARHQYFSRAVTVKTERTRQVIHKTARRIFGCSCRVQAHRTLKARMETPPTPMTPANTSACLRDSRPSGSGRRFVLSINESFATSYT